jgi:hypothetical protein
MLKTGRRPWGRIAHALLFALPILTALSAVLPNLLLPTASGQPGAAPPAAPAAPKGHVEAYPMPPELQRVNLLQQTAGEALAKSAGCITCHQNTGDPHGKDTLHLGCCDCHGGDPTATDKLKAHVATRFPDAWPTSANPVRTYTLLNHERPEFIRFVNPGDLRIAHISCGTTACHPKEVLQNRKSMMTNGCMLWCAALYNNGAFPIKWARYGGAYSTNGVPLRLQTVPPPTEWEQDHKGVVPYLDPLPRFEITQPGNILRIFERGGRFRPEIGIPEPEEINGQPRARLSNRGLGTENRTDPTYLGLQKTRLFDPTLNFLGTNDHPGDFRSSGCTGCHVIYANDRSVVNSGPYAPAGHLGLSRNPDPTIPKNEPGHPIEHKFVTGMPTSQCIVCHIHPGTNVLNSYTGMMWWDEETDGELMYPPQQKHPTSEEYNESQLANPDEAAAQGNWSNPAFLANLTDLNARTRHTQFADYHGHGWVFRAVFKKDRKGNLLDYKGNILPNVTNDQLQAAMRYQLQPPAQRVPQEGVPVHLMDIHLEKGMHCIDCHFIQDVHGNTKLYGEVRAAIEIGCIDCHGTTTQRATLHTSGPASDTSGPQGRNLETLRTPFGKRRFEWRGNKLYQNSMVEKDLSWECVQVADVINPKNEHYNAKAALAKTVRFGPNGDFEWGDVPNGDPNACPHNNKNMTCQACHSSWNPSCYGCHLPQKASRKTPHLHFEGDVTRNHISYDWRTLRDDVFMLAHDGDATGNRINPARSSCAVDVASYNLEREAVYHEQQTISSEGLSGIAFSTNVPHTVRGRGDTKMCTDCHVSRNNDNNAIMGQLLMLGTGYLNLIGKYCWVAEGEHGLEAVVVTERDEPEAVMGSYLHHLAFPDYYAEHVRNGGELKYSHHHPGHDVSDPLFHPHMKSEILQVQNRGEFMYAACGEAGVRVFDIAFIDDKAFSERIKTAPVSPLGQRFFLRTKYAVALAAPVTTAPDPTRTHRPENHEPTIPELYAYLYVLDRYDGLILSNAATTLNGDPTDNFLKADVIFNPDGILKNGTTLAIVGNLCYVGCEAGLVIVSLEEPKHPKVVNVIGPDVVKHVKSIAAEFRYGFITDDEGVKVLDITDPKQPKLVARLDMPEANSIYVARDYAYVAAGSQGLVILDITHPDHPKIDQVYNADGKINDLRDVKLGITYNSEFAYLADGHNGLEVVQLTSPETPGNDGFSTRPTPHLIAVHHPKHGACVLSVARGLDRDRAVDEAGNQLSVFGRVGARPFNREEMNKMYLRGGQVWTVSDEVHDYPPPHAPTPVKPQAAPAPSPVLRKP